MLKQNIRVKVIKWKRVAGEFTCNQQKYNLGLSNDRASRAQFVLELKSNNSNFVRTRLKIKRILNIYTRDWLEYFLYCSSSIQSRIYLNCLILMSLKPAYLGVRTSSFRSSKSAHLKVRNRLNHKLKIAHL